MRELQDRTMAADELERAIGRADILGDIAIVAIPPARDQYKEEIARAIMARRGKVKTVLNKVTKPENDDRVPHYEILAGYDTIACYREFGLIYRFDVTRVFFNGRLGSERQRVAGKLTAGENVLVPFCGVGPFAIPAAARGCRVIGVEKNPEACRWLALNARLNGVRGNIDILNGDAFLIPSMLDEEFDRAIIPTPYGLDHVLERLVPMVRRGGMIHFYTFKKKHQIDGLADGYGRMGLAVERCRRCGNVAPGVSRWAFDLKVG